MLLMPSSPDVYNLIFCKWLMYIIIIIIYVYQVKIQNKKIASCKNVKSFLGLCSRFIWRWSHNTERLFLHDCKHILFQFSIQTICRGSHALDGTCTYMYTYQLPAVSSFSLMGTSMDTGSHPSFSPKHTYHVSGWKCTST